MSKKRLLLASAVLSMGVLASCGGGGGGGSSTPPPPPPPSATDVAKVLVVFQKGTAGTAGATYTYQVATIKSDGSYTLSPVANDAAVDIKLYSRWTFANGAMLLQDENANVYFYNPSNNQITSLGIQANGFEPQNFFFAAYGDYVAVRTGANTFRVVDKTGKVSPVMTTGGIPFFDFTPNFVIARDNTTNSDCVIKASDAQTLICIGTAPNNQIGADSNKRILQRNDGRAFLVNPDTGDLVDLGVNFAAAPNGSLVNFSGYRFTKVGSDWYFLFQNAPAATNWMYVKLTGTTVVRDTNKIHLKNAIGIASNNIRDAALDADGKAVVLADDGAGDDRVIVFSDPSNYNVYVNTTADAIAGNAFNGARIVYLGKGNGIVETALAGNPPAAIVGASVPTIGSIPAGFDTTIGGVILRKDNEMVIANFNYDLGNNDCKYINLANVTNMTANDYIEKDVTNVAAFTLRGRTSAGTYVDDTVNFYRVNISNNPCVRLNNVTVANSGVNAVVANTAQPSWIKGVVVATVANPVVPRDFNFFSSKILAHQRAFDGNAVGNTQLCEITDLAGIPIATNAPQAYLLDLDNDTRTAVGPSTRLGCFDNLGGERIVADAVSLKMSYIYDLNTGAVMYGFNPLLNPVCSGVDRFDKLVVNIGNTTAEISKVKDGWCVVGALGIVP